MKNRDREMTAQSGEKAAGNPSARAARSAAARAVFRDPSEELKAICAALANEVSDWPQVTARGMFGATMIYRGDRIIAALPKTKSMSQRDAIMLKFYVRSEAVERKLTSDPRIRKPMVMREENKGTGEGAKWVELVVAGPEDVNNALDWLAVAYEAAKCPGTSRGQRAARSRSSATKSASARGRNVASKDGSVRRK